ncbi:MAG: hypothetical protein AMXMBFR84_36340 [Candidatus Hydrogenedentota bacterium]
MNGDIRTTWLESGLGAVLSAVLKVPAEPPRLPARSSEQVVTTHPSPGFLHYSLLGLWIVSAIFVLGLVLLSVIVAIEEPAIAALVLVGGGSLLACFVIILYLLTYVVYCTTWYVITDRSVRIRTGVLTILETTITFENVQNVSVSQGPLQRIYGIADVQIDTAGGGGGAAAQGGQPTLQNMHKGVIRGVSNAPELRDLIVKRMKHSRTSGLGDDRKKLVRSEGLNGREYIAALHEIRDALQSLAR